MRRHTSIFCLISASGFFFFTISQLSMFNVISEALFLEFGLSSTQLGHLSSFYLYGLSLALLPAGLLLDKFSTRRLLVAAMFILILIIALMLYLPYLEIVAFYRFMSGMTNAFAFLGSMRIAVSWFPRRIALAAGAVIGIGLSGGIVGNIGFSFLITLFTWQTVMLINGLMGVFLWLLLVVFLKDSPTEQEISALAREHLSIRQQLKKVIANRVNWLCGCCLGLLNLPVVVLGAVWGNLYLMQYYGFNAPRAGVIISLIFFGIVVGAPISGWLSDRFKKQKSILLIGACLSLVVSIVILLDVFTAMLGLTVLFFLLGVVISCQVIGFPMVVKMNPIQLKSTATAFVSLLLNLIGAVSQPLYGWLLSFNWEGNYINNTPYYSSGDFFLAMLIFPVSFVIAIILASLLKKR